MGMKQLKHLNWYMKDYRKLTINPNVSISDAMKYLNTAPLKCLIVIDDGKKLIGTLTDGDIRRAILGGAVFSEPIEKYLCKEPTVLIEDAFTTEEAIGLLKNKKLELIPILNKENILVELISIEDSALEHESSKNILTEIPVVIMAGGKGTRLEPFTKILPKPLVPIKDKPIIEHIINRFKNMGCNSFFLTINYKSKIIKAYFEELEYNHKISFVDESQPLGTAGSLKYLDGVLDKPFFVTNCDVIIETDYQKLYQFHLDNNNDITLVASAKEYIIPYGACELDQNGYLSHINEKPKYDFLLNTGLYILNPSILKMIPEGKFFHITHLIEAAKNNGKKVGIFPIDDGAWIDIGEWAEYKKAIEHFNSD